MDTLTFTYIRSGTTYTRDIDVLSLRGWTDPDEFENFGVQQSYLSGSVQERFIGFRRIVTIDFGVINDRDDRIHLLYWMLAANKSITYSSDTAHFALLDFGRYANEWLESCELGRQFILSLAETDIRTTMPTSVVEGEVAYIKRKVAITGTQASPEAFTTNAGKLATDETGANYPTFDTDSYAYQVTLVPYQEAQVNLVTEPSISGGGATGALTFQIAVSDSGKAFSDGAYYADIVIIAQAK